MDVQVDEAEGQPVDGGRNWNIPAADEALMEEAAKENLLADRGQDHCGENDGGKGRGERHGSAHLGEMKAVANADAPVVGRGAEESHAGGVDHKPGAGSGQGAKG